MAAPLCLSGAAAFVPDATEFGTDIKRSSGVFSGICCGFALSSKIEAPAQVGYAGTARSADIYERGLGIDEASMLSKTLP